MNEIYKLTTKNDKDEIEKIERDRTISDANLLKGGARWIIDDDGKRAGMDITGYQDWLIKRQMEISKMGEEKWIDIIEDIFEKEKIKQGDKIEILTNEGERLLGIYREARHDQLAYIPMENKSTLAGIKLINIMDLRKIKK